MMVEIFAILKNKFQWTECDLIHKPTESIRLTRYQSNHYTWLECRYENLNDILQLLDDCKIKYYIKKSDDLNAIDQEGDEREIITSAMKMVKNEGILIK